jgi:GNAT superfamily N-acetyltransferase
VATGAAIAPLLPALAALRVSVFREFPYLYDGNPAYEEAYLQTCASAPGAALILAEDAGRIVGASTCLPLAAETPNVRAPFEAASYDISRIFYFGESVLAPDYRGQGIGKAFFEAREAQAAGYGITTFCAVARPPDHPLRPPGYRPLDRFWEARGYRQRPSLTCRMSWRDVGEAQESEKTLVFWTKYLT